MDQGLTLEGHRCHRRGFRRCSIQHYLLLPIGQVIMKPYIHIVGKVELFEFREQGLMGSRVESLAEIAKKNSSYFMVSLQVLEPIMCHMQKCRDSQLSLLESPLQSARGLCSDRWSLM